MLGVGYYLPDAELVDGIVDTKFRPDVINQIPWFASMLTIGKTVNKSGKQVNRKGAIMATDGERIALGYFLGCNRVPRTYATCSWSTSAMTSTSGMKSIWMAVSRPASCACVWTLARRVMTRLAWIRSLRTQPSTALTSPVQTGDISPEDGGPAFAVSRWAQSPSPSDPRLTLAGDFKASESGETVATHRPENIYYLACPHCGHALNRDLVFYKAKRPEMEALGKYGIEVSQISTPAIGLTQIVAAWASAVADPDKMTAFRCDRWARPKSSTRGLIRASWTDRGKTTPSPLCLLAALALVAWIRVTAFGLWRVRSSEGDKAFAWAEQISPTVAQSRIPQLFEACGLSCLFIDIGNERQLARNIVITAPACLRRGPVGRTRRRPRGMVPVSARTQRRRSFWWRWHHEIRRTQEDRAYPVIRANRDECTRVRVPHDDGLVAVVDNKVRTEPIMHMPGNTPGCNVAVNILQQHFISGSRKVPGKDGKSLSFTDKVENHYLLANAYSALSEQVAEFGIRNRVFPLNLGSLMSIQTSARWRYGNVRAPTKTKRTLS